MTSAEYFTKTKIEVLLVEDNEGDVRLIKEAFSASKFPWHFTVAQDGVEALMRLNGLGRYNGSEKPDLILLDLNLPKLNGFEVLTEIRRNPSFRETPVVILTCSQLEEDRQKALGLEASLFLTKPMNTREYPGLVETLEAFCRKSLGIDPKWPDLYPFGDDSGISLS